MSKNPHEMTSSSPSTPSGCASNGPSPDPLKQSADSQAHTQSGAMIAAKKSLMTNLVRIKEGGMSPRYFHLSTSEDWEAHIRSHYGMQPSQQCVYDHLVMLRYGIEELGR